MSLDRDLRDALQPLAGDPVADARAVLAKLPPLPPASPDGPVPPQALEALGAAHRVQLDFTREEAGVVRAYVAEPLNHDRITPRLVRFIVDGGLLVRQAAPRWATPTLLLYAGADRCVAPRGSDAFAASAPASMVAHRRYDGMAHEIFNEPDQARVLADLSTWLAARWPQPV